MPADLQIRRGEPADAEALVAFNCAMALETEGRQLDMEVVSRGVRRLLEEADLGFYLIAEHQQRIVGGLMVTTEWSDWRDGFFWWIQSVYVVPEFRRKGVYRALYHRLKSLAEAREDIRGFRLYVEKDNRAAQQTYRSLGMAESYYAMYEEVLRPQ